MKPKPIRCRICGGRVRGRGGQYCSNPHCVTAICPVCLVLLARGKCCNPDCQLAGGKYRTVEQVAIAAADRIARRLMSSKL